jgi:phage terminase large subunit
MKAELLAINYPGISILIMRRTYPDLLETHIYRLREMTYGIARYKTDEKLLLFNNRSRVKFGYCDSEGDLLQYQGREYDVIFIDEATQFEESWYVKLTACVRGTNGYPKRMYLTCNPGGIGHAWVKRLFIDREYHKNENPRDYRFIKATVYDNVALMKADPEYVKVLEALPEKEREKWLYGNWNVFEGQYFSEWEEDIHTVPAFPVPYDWRIYFTMDYGLDMFAGILSR